MQFIQFWRCLTQGHLTQGLLSGRIQIFVLLLASFFSAQSAYAQFEKTPWRSANKLISGTFVDSSGQSFSADSLRGKKVVINFWATWCAPCKEELPTLQVFSDLQDPSKTVVLTINVKEPPSRALRFMQQNQITLPLIPDPQGEWAKKFDVKVFPTTLLVVPSGQIQWRIVGEVDWSAQTAQTWLDSLR
jgi:thiol-disulfide isomerase/thioredoxin